MQRRATIAVAMTLAGASAPASIEAQVNRNIPGADTPRLLVAVFASPERLNGVAIADAVRSRLTTVSNPRQLYISPKEQMVSFLESSGYKADSSLGLTDLKELARGLRADEIINGYITRLPNGPNRIEPRMLSAIDPTKAQPLPTIETTNLNEAARQIERSYQEARKQWPDVKACENHIRGGAMDKAIASARAGIVKYPNATIARICLANAFSENKQPDSALVVANEILRLDPRSAWGPRMAFTAWRAKADMERDSLKSQEYREQSVRMLVQMLGADPTNQGLQNQVIVELAKLGRPAVALPIVDTLLVNNPSDPLLLRTRWLLLLAAAAQTTDSVARPAAFERAVVAGEAWVRNDSTLADSTYYERQIAAAFNISQQRAAEVASKATRRYPANQDFWWYRANAEYRTNQFQAATQSLGALLKLNPKFQRGAITPNVMLGQIYVGQRMTDSAIATARRAVAAGEDSKTWGNFLLQPARDLVNNAQTVQNDTIRLPNDSVRAAEALVIWEAALAISQEADKLSPSPTSKFLIGVSSFSIGTNALQRAQTIGQRPRDQAKACPFVKRAQDMLLLTQLNMPAGGQINPQTAQMLLGYVSTYAPAADDMARRWNCK